jgi:hypothetical protein
MPAVVDKCVSDLMAKWKKDPSKRPAPRKKGQTEKDQAWAICTAAHNKAVKNALELMLEGDGFGPTFIGAAATNRPYIPQLKPTKVVEGEDGEKSFLVHLANAGQFNHPLSGMFVLNRAVFSTMSSNFKAGVIGQDAAYDARHKPELGALGWFEDLMVGDEIGEGQNEFWGKVKPTPAGIENVASGQFRYSSMEFHRNYKRDDVVLDLEEVTDDFCLVLEMEEKEPEENMPEDTVSLEEFREMQDQLAELKKAREDAESAAEAAQERAVTLEREAMETSVASIVELAKTRRDDEGNGLPRQLIDWVSKFLKFEDFGKDGTIKLSDDDRPSLEYMKYAIGAVRQLLLEMPGSVPAERRTHSEAGNQADDFDYDAEWED